MCKDGVDVGGVPGVYLVVASPLRQNVKGLSPLKVIGVGKPGRDQPELHRTKLTKCSMLTFADAFDRVLPTLRHGLDMVFLDGDKQETSLFRSFENLASHLNSGSVMVFDDIHWSSEMWQAWQMLGAIGNSLPVDKC